MDPRFFKSAAMFRRWLAYHHDRAPDRWVGFYKKASGKGGLTYAEALDEALCFGWIDGIVKRVDDDSYVQRFTPRRAASHWSLINVKRAGELVALGRMAPAGARAFASRTPERTGRASYEQRPRDLREVYQKPFRANRKAWAFFQAQPPGYRRTATFWVMSAVKEETRQKRLRLLIEQSALGVRLGQFTGKAPQTARK
jgi:uncharacterized protein YdeI (YjbR/CyaY-like superfamily)